MLTRFFESADRDVQRFAATLIKLGAGGVLIWCVMLYGSYAAIQCARFVLGH